MFINDIFRCSNARSQLSPNQFHLQLKSLSQKLDVGIPLLFHPCLKHTEQMSSFLAFLLEARLNCLL